MKTLFFCICTILIFFGTGRIIANIRKPFLKKYTKSKRHKNATDIMVNNYWGNMISVTGIIIVSGYLFGITNITFFLISAVFIVIAYTFHVANASGETIDQTITIIINGNNKSLLQYMRGTMCFVAALIMAGFISSSFVAPVLLNMNKEEAEEVEAPESNNTMHETNREKEEEFQKIIEDAFK